MRTTHKTKNVIASLVPIKTGDQFVTFDFAYHRDFHEQVCGADAIHHLATDPQEQNVVRSHYAGLISEHSHQQMMNWHQKFSGAEKLIAEFASMQKQLEEAQRKLLVLELVELRRGIPPIAYGYEEIYHKFLNGRLIYKPNEDNDIGKIELKIADLANPLEGTFDLSQCGNMEEYFSISTGYRKGHRPENANKLEIWFTPWFVVDKEMGQLASNHHLREISKGWDAAKAPIGIIWTNGEWNGTDEMAWCDYITSGSYDDLGRENLYHQLRTSARTKWCSTYHLYHSGHPKAERLYISFVKGLISEHSHQRFISEHSHQQMMNWHEKFLGGEKLIMKIPSLEKQLEEAQRNLGEAQTKLRVLEPLIIKTQQKEQRRAEVARRAEEERLAELRQGIPPIAYGYEEIYHKFLNGRLIYKPNSDNDTGKIELKIADLANPLDGTFDLSQCGDTGRYLSISTGYKKGKNPENANKLEIWFAPRFLIEKELKTTAAHFQGIMGSWKDTAPVGIFWTWGGVRSLSYSNLSNYNYLVTQNMNDISNENLRAASLQSIASPKVRHCRGNIIDTHLQENIRYSARLYLSYVN